MKHLFIFLAIIIYINHNLYCQDKSQNIDIEVINIYNANGKIGIALFEGEDGFPMDFEKVKSINYIAIQDLTINYLIKDVSAGEYAITVFHDEDLNGEVETNFIGMPKEGVGVSNNPKSRMGAPRYEDCKFHTDTLNSIIITMKYIGR